MNSDLTGKTTTVVDKSAYDLLAAEVAALRADAERYRWLRGSPLERGRCFSFDGLSLKCGSDLDAAIDAAIAKPTSAAGSTPTNQDNPGDNP